jgi:hypothetical protein
LRTFAALLTFLAVFIVIWSAVASGWAAVSGWAGGEDGPAAAGAALLLAPLIAFAAALAGAMIVAGPRSRT